MIKLNKCNKFTKWLRDTHRVESVLLSIDTITGEKEYDGFTHLTGYCSYYGPRLTKLDMIGYMIDYINEWATVTSNDSLNFTDGNSMYAMLEHCIIKIEETAE